VNNKTSENEFLGYIDSMWKQGEISENALIKIRDMYYKENGIKQEETLNNKVQSNDHYEQNISKNESYETKDIQNDSKEEEIKKQYTNEKDKTINELYNNEAKIKINEQNIIKPMKEKVKFKQESNITIILSLGILLILLSGIILATSTWELMSNGVKTISLFMVSILFFIMSSFAERKLKILKTSFAFWILGNLFLPVILLSIGFFKLLGTYLSIEGEGRYIYGIISCTICLMFFVYSAKKYKNKPFVWIALIDSEILYWFVLKQLNFSYNMEILMLLIFTLILTGVYHKLNKTHNIYYFAIKSIRGYVFINLILNIFHILGSIIYITFISTISEPNWFFNGIITVVGIIILASIITYWTYELKCRGGVFVSGALILAIQMICVIFRINNNGFLYYIVMHIGLLAIYGLVYYYNNFKYLKYIKGGTDIIILATMGILDLISIMAVGSIYTAVLLYILAMVMVITSKKAKDIFYVMLLKSTVPIIVFIANLFGLMWFELIGNLFSRQRFHMDFIYIILNIGIIYGISVILRLKNNNDYKICLYEGHIMLGLVYFCTLFFQIDRLICEIVIAIVGAICLCVAKKDFKIKIYLYGLITMTTIILFDLELFLHFNKTGIFILKPQNLFLCISLILTIIWKSSKEIWKKRLELYMIGIYSFGFLNSLIFNDFKKLDYILICLMITCIGLMGMFLYKSKRNILICIPIIYFWIMNLIIIYHFNKINQIIANCFVAGILILVGYVLCKIYEKISTREILYYNVFAGLSLILAVIISFGNAIPYMFNIFTLIVFGGFLYYISMLEENKYFKISLFIGSIIFNYFAYVRIILELDFLKNFRQEFLLVPSVIVLYLVLNYYFEKKNYLCTIISRIWYSLVGISLLFFNQENSAFNAITFCGLCIASIIVGFIIQNRLYFIGGAIFLILGVILNTLSFWISIPWWIYLLFGGTLLIFFASKNEFNKRNKENQKENFISKLLKRFKK